MAMALKKELKTVLVRISSSLECAKTCLLQAPHQPHSSLSHDESEKTLSAAAEKAPPQIVKSRGPKTAVRHGFVEHRLDVGYIMPT